MDESKQKACQRVLYALKYPMVLMNIPDREDALALARAHNISAEDLLMTAYKMSRET